MAPARLPAQHAGRLASALTLALVLLCSPALPHGSHEFLEHPGDLCGQIPDGTGLSPDGSGWVHVMRTGTYTLNARLLNRPDGPQELVAKGTYAVLPHKGPLVWTHHGVTEEVPTVQLLPSYDQLKR